MNIIETKNAPAAIGPYSQAITSGMLVYTSGQIPIDPATGSIEAADIEGQARQAIQNLAAVLSVYAELFPGKPARSCVEVSALPRGALVEIEAVAELGG